MTGVTHIACRDILHIQSPAADPPESPHHGACAHDRQQGADNRDQVLPAEQRVPSAKLDHE